MTNNTVRNVNSIGIDFIGGELDINPDPTKAPRNGLCRFNAVSGAHANYGGGFAAGIYVDGARDLIVENNVVFGSDMGIEVGAENAGIVASGIIVRNNVVYGNDKVCLVFGGFEAAVGRVRESQFTNNTCYQNDTLKTGAGELWIQFAEDNSVRRNIFVGLESALLWAEDGSLNNTLNDNLWFAPGGASTAQFTWQGTTHTGFDTYRSASGQDGQSRFADPQLVNPADADFHVMPASPVVDAGGADAIPGPGEVDIDLQARAVGSQIDIGADEVVPSTCTYTVDPLGQPFGRGGGIGSATVTAPGNCAWTTTSLDAWITAAGLTHLGTATASYSVAASNTGPLFRIGTLLVAGQRVTVTQLGSDRSPVATIITPTTAPSYRTAADVSLQSGVNLLTVTAIDASGNQGTAAIALRRNQVPRVSASCDPCIVDAGGTASATVTVEVGPPRSRARASRAGRACQPSGATDAGRRREPRSDRLTRGRRRGDPSPR